MEIFYKNDNELSYQLGSTKDKTKPPENSGIYTVTCVKCNK